MLCGIRDRVQKVIIKDIIPWIGIHGIPIPTVRDRLLARKGGAGRGLQRGRGGGCGAGKSPDRAELENSFSSLGPATRRPQAGDCFVGKRGRGRVCPVPPSTHYPRQQQVNPTSEGGDLARTGGIVGIPGPTIWPGHHIPNGNDIPNGDDIPNGNAVELPILRN